MAKGEQNEDLLVIGKRIKGMIKLRKFKQKQFAKHIDMPIGTLNNIIRGIREPGIQKLKVIAEALEANIHWILTGEGEVYTDYPSNNSSDGGFRQDIVMTGEGGHNQLHQEHVGNVQVQDGGTYISKRKDLGKPPAGDVGNFLEEFSALSKSDQETVMAMIKVLQEKK